MLVDVGSVEEVECLTDLAVAVKFELIAEDSVRLIADLAVSVLGDVQGTDQVDIDVPVVLIEYFQRLGIVYVHIVGIRILNSGVFVKREED